MIKDNTGNNCYLYLYTKSSDNDEQYLSHNTYNSEAKNTEVQSERQQQNAWLTSADTTQCCADLMS